ncbi:MAG: 50S ribosomal protein L25 [Patescibacteria group bacterium]
MELAVKNRTELGKKTNALRAKGLIPAELYGKGVQNIHLSVAEKDFRKIHRAGAEHGVITIVTEDGKKHSALIASIAHDGLSQKVLSIDFHQVRMDQKIRTRIPIEFTGESPVVKLGHVIVKVMNDIEIEALPAHIPTHLEVDITALDAVGSTIHVKDLKVPSDVKIIVSPESVIVTVNEKRKEEVVAPPPVALTDAATPAEGAAPAIETPST